MKLVAMFLTFLTASQPLLAMRSSNIQALALNRAEQKHLKKYLFNYRSLHSAVREWGSNSTSATLKYGPMSEWDVSRVDNMNTLFWDMYQFNEPIGTWNVGKVTDMFRMFTQARNFNQAIGKWKVDKVTSMREMFHGAYKFNQPIGAWNVGKVRRMDEMFKASPFNQSIKTWYDKWYSGKKKCNYEIDDSESWASCLHPHTRTRVFDKLDSEEDIFSVGCVCHRGYEPNEKGKCVKCPVCWDEGEAFTCGSSR